MKKKNIIIIKKKKLAKDSCPWKTLGQNFGPIGGSQSPFI